MSMRFPEKKESKKHYEADLSPIYGGHTSNDGIAQINYNPCQMTSFTDVPNYSYFRNDDRGFEQSHQPDHALKNGENNHCSNPQMQNFQMNCTSSSAVAKTQEMIPASMQGHQ